MTANRAHSRLWRLAAMSTRHPTAAILLAVALALIALLGALRLRADASLEGMLDAADPAAVAMARVLDGFGAVDDLLVLASVPADDSAAADVRAARLVAFAERLEAAIRASPDAAGLVEAVAYRPDEQTRAFFEQIVIPARIYYLDAPSFEAARQRLTRDEMARQIRRNEVMISAPGPAADALAQALLKDPLRLHEFVLGQIGARRSSSAYLSPDGRSLLIRVIGAGAVGDIEFSKQITSTVAALAHRANTDRLEIDISGGYTIAAQSERAIRSDMIASVIGSVICLQLLFVLAYRQPFRCFFLAFFPVALGVLYGFGILSMFSSTISPATAVVGAILAGMGIDYSIHFLSHYQLTRAGSEAGPVDAAPATSLTLAPALFAACATSIIGFLAISRSDVQALRDFSVIGTLGLACALAATFWVIPALLSLTDRNRQGKALRVRLDVAPLLNATSRHRLAAMGVSLAIFAAALGVIGVAGHLVELESDLTVMHPRPNPPLDAQAKIAQRMGADPGSLLVHLQAESPDGLQRLAHEVDRRLKSPAVGDAGVVATFGLASLLPDPAIAPLRRAAVSTAEVERIVADFRAVIADSAFSPEVYEPYAMFLHRLLTNANPPVVSDLRNFPSLANTVLGKSGSEAITLIFLDRPLDQRPQRAAAIIRVREALADLPHATLTGLSVIHFDTEQTIHRELPRLLLIAGGAVAVYLLLHFRSITATGLALLPTLFSLACVLAFWHLSGQKLNIMNLIAIPLLIGIDVDYGIFLVSLARQSQHGDGSDLTGRIAASCHAVCVSALTTALGFGSLVLTSVPAIRSLGWAVGVGVLACLAGTLFLLAPILIMRAEKREDVTVGSE